MPKPSRDSFSFFHTVTVRFRDVDLAGHAHHSTALVYFEEARIAYWQDVVGRTSSQDVDYVLADAHVRFHARIHHPERLQVGVRVVRLGKKHFEMEYGAWGEDGEVRVSGSTTQVMYDYEEGESSLVPSFIRELIEEQDGPF